MKQIQDFYPTEPNYGGNIMYNRLSARVGSVFKWAKAAPSATPAPDPAPEDVMEDDFVIIANDKVNVFSEDDADCVQLLTRSYNKTEKEIFDQMLVDRFKSMSTIEQCIIYGYTIYGAIAAIIAIASEEPAEPSEPESDALIVPPATK